MAEAALAKGLPPTFPPFFFYGRDRACLRLSVAGNILTRHQMADINDLRPVLGWYISPTNLTRR